MRRLKYLPKSLVSKDDVKYFYLASLQLQWLYNKSYWVEVLETLFSVPETAYKLKVNMVDFYVKLSSDYISKIICDSTLSPIDLKLDLIQTIISMPLDEWINYQMLEIVTLKIWDLN